MPQIGQGHNSPSSPSSPSWPFSSLLFLFSYRSLDFDFSSLLNHSWISHDFSMSEYTRQLFLAHPPQLEWRLGLDCHSIQSQLETSPSVPRFASHRFLGIHCCKKIEDFNIWTWPCKPCRLLLIVLHCFTFYLTFLFDICFWRHRNFPRSIHFQNKYLSILDTFLVFPRYGIQLSTKLDL